jgi:exodeoxyribonuclease VII large subunit
VISSATGAALRDVLHVVERRYPVLEVVVLPVAVQGERSETEVLAALSRIPSIGADVVLITRGGGSLEDLWTFNLESVARAVAACPVPTVSAVGHQTDFTIVDFAADVRAPTPSAGAELVTPDCGELLSRVTLATRQLARVMTTGIRDHDRHLRHLRARLTSPRARLQQQMQRADELEERLRRGVSSRLQDAAANIHAIRRALRLVHPGQRIEQEARRLRGAADRLAAAAGRRTTAARNALGAAVRTLEAVSPLATLARGYAVLTAADDPRAAVTSIRQTRPGARLTARLHDGALEVDVLAISTDHGLPRLPPGDGTAA